MKIRKAYKYRVKTNSEIEEKFRQFSGCCRLVWNKAWWLNKKRLEEKQPLIWYQESAWFLKIWKQSEELSFLKDAPSQPLQQTLRSLERAIKDGFDKKQPLKKMPKFKKRGQSDSFRYPQGFKIAGNRIFLPKVGWVRFYKSRGIDGTPKNVTVSRRGNHWYVSIQVEKEIGNPIHPSSSAVGIDMGVTRFATLSDGSYLEPVNSFRALENKLAQEKRKLSRKVKFSGNWKKQKQKIAKIHIKIANTRMDYLHKASTVISKNHAVVVLENLQVRNMSSSAKGSIESPGTNIKAKSGLNKSILDQGWYEFRRQLEYKQLWNGGEVRTVPPQHTSQTCPGCDHVHPDNRKTQSEFVCTKCGLKGNADYIAALNILAAGHAVSACGEMVQSDRSVKQEPAIIGNDSLQLAA